MRKRVSDPRLFGRVAVLMGGWSSERDVSMVSGKAVCEALLRKSVDAHAVDATREALLSLRAQKFDRAFIVLHGAGGEDGVAQAALELQGIPYTGSGVSASAIKLDKLATKRIWRAEGLPTPDFLGLRNEGDGLKAAGDFGLPMVIKPSAEGSSVGVTIVRKVEQLAPAFRAAAGDGRAVMAERFVAGREMTVAILDGEALPSIHIEPAGEFYDYHAKYVSDETKYHCPSGVDSALERTLADLALTAFDLIGARGWGRVDFILDAEGAPWLLEVNTVPGMTSHSLVPIAAKAAGMGFDELCWAILETSLGEEGA